MEDYGQAIQTALNNAPEVYLDIQALPLSEPTISTMRTHGDSQPVFSEGHRNAPNMIIVSTLSKLASLQEQVAVEAGFYDNAALQDAIDHEKEHALAAEALNAQGIYFGLELAKVYPTHDSEEYTLKWRLFQTERSLMTTKLGFAAITAHPIEPSEGDIDAIQNMGYNGVDEVGYRATRFNQKHGHAIPIPRSYNPRQATHIPIVSRFITKLKQPGR